MTGTMTQGARELDARVTDFPRRRFAVSCITVLISALILSSAALYNGYPLVFYDTFTYLADGDQFFSRLFHWQANVAWPANGRPVYYGVAIWPLHLEWSLWPIVFVQALLLGHLMRLALRCMGVSIGPVGFLLFVATLTLMTPVSLHVSHVMPDIFAAVMILCMYLLGYRREGLRRWELFYIVILATSAIMFHVSHFLISLALLAQAAVIWVAVPAWRQHVRPVLLAVPVVAGLAGLASYPWIARHQIALAPNSLTYYLARLWVDGQARAYLQDACKTTPYVVCGHLDTLPTDDISGVLWGYGSDAPAIHAESPRIILATLRTYPGWAALSAAQNFGMQLLTFQLEVWTPTENERRSFSLPPVLFGFDTSRQMSGDLDDKHLGPSNDVQAVFMGISAFAVVPLIFLLRRRRSHLLTALLTIAVGLVANGLAGGIIVGPYPRYEGRVIWLLPFWVIAAGLWLYARRNDRPILPSDGQRRRL